MNKKFSTLLIAANMLAPFFGFLSNANSKELRYSPLPQFATLDDIAFIENQLAAGADINSLDEDGHSVLTKSIEDALLGYEVSGEVALFLLSKGADPNVGRRQPLLSDIFDAIYFRMRTIEEIENNVPESIYYTPERREEELKKSKRVIKIADSLFDAVIKVPSIDVNNSYSSAGPGRWNSYLEIYSRGHSSPELKNKINGMLARLVKERKADVNHMGLRPAIHAVMESGNVELAELLLDNGADINDQRSELTPLQEAIGSGQLQVVELALTRGADVNAYNSNGYDAFFYAIEKFKDNDPSAMAKIADLLLENGANLNRLTLADPRTSLWKRPGNSPINHAIISGEIKAIEYLLKNGALLSKHNREILIKMLSSCRNTWDQEVRHCDRANESYHFVVSTLENSD